MHQAAKCDGARAVARARASAWCRWLQLALGAVLLPAVLTACGGGGAGAGPAPAPAPAPASGTASTYTVSVTVTGLRHSYNGLTLRNNGGDDLKVYGDGSASFKTALSGGSGYAVTVSSQPTGPDQTCTVSNGSGTVGSSNVTNVSIDCPYATTYAVGGTVTGLTGGTVDLIYQADNTSLPFVMQVNANGAFVFLRDWTNAITGTVYGVSIASQPSNPAQVCVVNQGTGTIAAADVGNVQVVCGYHSVAVTVTGLRQTARGLTVRNNGIDGMQPFNGTFKFYTPLPSGATYDVTLSAQPTGPAQVCVVRNGSGIVGNSDVNVAIDCPYPSAHAVGGTVSGLTGQNLGLRYTANDISFPISLNVNANGAYAFAADSTSAVSGSNYTVSISAQPTNPDQTCVVGHASGTVGAVDVGDVNVSCGPPVVASTCVPPTGAGTSHGSINAAQTWTQAGSPHTVPFDIGISAAVTIEPCAVVRIVKSGTVTINPTGSLIAAGALGQPITIEALSPGQPWSSIRNLGGKLSLSHVVLTGGGAPLNTNPAYAGALHMQSPGLSGSLHVDDVEITGSASQGVYINGPVGFDASSQNLRVSGSAGYPVHVYARVVGSVPSGRYTGNAHDEIAIAGSGGPVVDDQTLHERGVPYHVGSGADGGRLDVQAPVGNPVAVLSIEPGVSMRFPPGGTLNIDTNGANPARGALIAVGGATPAQAIVFTSDQAQPKAGDWLGLAFNGAVDPRTRLQNTRVEFAGGASATGGNSCPFPGIAINDAAIRIFGPPATQFITNSEIRSSARFGIDRGWRADLQPDFLASNAFTAVAACKQTTPRTANGVCPTTPPCP